MALKDIFSFLFQRSAGEERVAQYVVREHDRGRALSEILEDRYVVNRLQSPEQRARLLDRVGGQGLPTRTGPLVGRHGIVTHEIDPTIGTGRINVGGEDWAARCHESIPTGTKVRVVAADGIVLEVTRA